MLINTEAGKMVTVIDGGGAMMPADTVKVCKGPLMATPELVSITDSELLGMLNVPVLPDGPVATTLSLIVQLPLGAIVGVGNAVIVI